ncbi:cytochrome c [Spirulina major CS-329]|uniref:c-type cytochrome n=1 Tax=Spirulina TaxID=1154 RepID=UPI00232C9821|nr:MULTISPECIES: cytochrome c [Spirulina]MDB9495382.1 cytochrome c [Spirulina subsalsa CS-330]MDB9501927.1 cytochrome c [Spirulina major CS-329]
MTNPSAPSSFAQRSLVIVVTLVSVILLGVGLYLFQGRDPYLQSVLPLSGDPERGHAIFEINCAGCHGIYATGDVGPSLENLSRHKSDRMIIHQVISGETPPMPKFQPKPQDMADLLSYLKRL